MHRTFLIRPSVDRPRSHFSAQKLRRQVVNMRDGGREQDWRIRARAGAEFSFGKFTCC